MKQAKRLQVRAAIGVTQSEVDKPLAATIRDVSANDAGPICAIYNHYIEQTYITFEETPLSRLDIQERIAEVEAGQLPWLVAECGDEIAGYAYASKWKGRCAYRHTVEVTVYLAQAFTGQQIGAQLYGALFDRLRERSVHVAVGGIALPNAASVALHEKMGMKKVAHFEQVGYKFDEWIDVGYWQATF